MLQMHVTMGENSESARRHTHNNLDVAIIKECSSWTSHIGDGVFKLTAVRTHLEHVSKEEALDLLPGQTALQKSMPDGNLEQHSVCSYIKSDGIEGCEGANLLTMLTGRCETLVSVAHGECT